MAGSSHLFKVFLTKVLPPELREKLPEPELIEKQISKEMGNILDSDKVR